MDKIYIIFKNYSDYELSPGVMGFKLTFEEAEKYVNDKNIEYKEGIEKWESLHKRRKEIESKFEKPIQPEIKDWPRWASNEKITDEMRAVREQIFKENDLASKEHSELVSEYDKKIMIELQKTILDEELEVISKWFKTTDKRFEFTGEWLSEHQPYSYKLCKPI